MFTIQIKTGGAAFRDEYGMSRRKWADVIKTLRKTDGVTITDSPDTDADGLFVDFKYVTVDCNNTFWYMDSSSITDGFVKVGHCFDSKWKRTLLGIAL
ncbi:hypothetical protein LJC33_06565 [Eubacteriales bacterium OttesenSCG-928-N13]|nr:hypothetical protein [Eubacteriales bacterium OttesenSCG-928-N13]